MSQCELDLSGKGSDPVADYCKQDNDPPLSIKGRKFHYKLSNY